MIAELYTIVKLYIKSLYDIVVCGSSKKQNEIERQRHEKNSVRGPAHGCYSSLNVRGDKPRTRLSTWRRNPAKQWKTHYHMDELV